MFGESREQELSEKQSSLPKDIEWHFIGHLQTNKVKYIAPYVALVHSVDSIKLLQELDKQAEKCGRVIDCLLELHVAQEETKYGFDFDDVRALYRESVLSKFKHVKIRGLMGMASNTDNQSQIREEFSSISSFFSEVKDSFDPQVDTLSMGMTHDWELAVEEGVRLSVSEVSFLEKGSIDFIYNLKIWEILNIMKTRRSTLFSNDCPRRRRTY